MGMFNGLDVDTRLVSIHETEKSSYKSVIVARNVLAVAVIDHMMNEWACYVAVVDDSDTPTNQVYSVADCGQKQMSTVARVWFPSIELPYRR
jgi:hypothetical protein